MIRMSAKHYDTVASWMEKVSLLFLASLVVQRVYAGSSLADPAVILGIGTAMALYIFAFVLLLKS